jgi:hypothetical protein
MSEPRRLDDSLARMAKWEELRRRADAAAAGATGAGPDRRPAGTGLAAVSPAGRAVPASAVDDLIQTLQELALRQPSLSVAAIAQQDGVTWHLHTVRADGQVQVVARTETRLDSEYEAHPAPAPASAPVAAPASEPVADSAIAARLAEVLRTNPTMLGE